MSRCPGQALLISLAGVTLTVPPLAPSPEELQCQIHDVIFTQAPEAETHGSRRNLIEK